MRSIALIVVLFVLAGAAAFWAGDRVADRVETFNREPPGIRAN